jgi:hypothetical protein
LPGVHDAAKRVGEGVAGGVGVHHVDVVLHVHAAPLGVEVRVADDADLAQGEAQAEGHDGVAVAALGLAHADEEGGDGPDDDDAGHAGEHGDPHGEGVDDLDGLLEVRAELAEHGRSGPHERPGV